MTRQDIYIVTFNRNPVAAFTDRPELIDWLSAWGGSLQQDHTIAITKVPEGGLLQAQPIWTVDGFLDQFA